MEEKHLFRLKSFWAGNGEDDGEIRTEDYACRFGKEDGWRRKAGRTSPEELLVAAVASCYSITVCTLSERRGIPLRAIELTAEGEVIRRAGHPEKLAVIRLWPRLLLETTDEPVRRLAEQTARNAEKYCMISNALQGNVEITISLSVAAATPVNV